MTPDTIQAWFDGSAVVIMFLYGILCKYVPVFAKIPNATIPWVNLVGYILAKFILPTEAHAGGFGSFFAGMGVLVGGFVHSVFASQLYERFFRAPLEGWFGWRKAV
jgi:hypothetical protein